MFRDTSYVLNDDTGSGSVCIAWSKKFLPKQQFTVVKMKCHKQRCSHRYTSIDKELFDFYFSNKHLTKDYICICICLLLSCCYIFSDLYARWLVEILRTFILLKLSSELNSWNISHLKVANLISPKRHANDCIYIYI